MFWWCSVRMLHLWSRCCWFDSQLSGYHFDGWLQAGKPSQYVTSRLCQLSLSSLRGRKNEYRPVWLWLRWSMFTCVGLQLAICDPIWQMMLRSSVVGFPCRTVHHPYFFPLPFCIHTTVLSALYSSVASSILGRSLYSAIAGAGSLLWLGCGISLTALYRLFKNFIRKWCV